MNKHNIKIVLYIIICLAVCTILCIIGLVVFSKSRKSEAGETIQPDIRVEKDQNIEIITSAETQEINIKNEGEEVTEMEPEEMLEAELSQEIFYVGNLDAFNAGDIIDANLLDTADMSKYFTVSDIVEGDDVYSRIYGKSYVTNDDISLSSLKYLKLLHYNFDGNIQVGELIVNESIAEDVIALFKDFYNIEYQIESMRLIDDYWMEDGESSDTNSIEHNNSSAFCYRRMTGGKSLSNHAYGKAIDINPQQNPYVSYKSGVPVWDHSNADDYIDRETGLPHVITHSDPAYELFKKYGFSWGGDWKTIKDYQHFEHK